MQYRKYATLFAAALIGFGAAGVDAAAVKSVTISSPADSGKVLGIDSTFVVTAVVEDFNPDAGDGIIMYLFSGSDSVLVQGTTHAVTLKDSSGAQAIVFSSAISTKVTGKGKVTDGTTTSALSSTNAVAVAWSRGQTAAVANGGIGRGLRDSVKVSPALSPTPNEIATYTWYGKINATMGTVTNIRAAAIAFDKSQGNKGYSPLIVSPTTKTIGVDGDRPQNPQSLLGVAAGADDVQGVAHESSGTVRKKTDVGGGAASPWLGVGDTLALNTVLGTQATGVLGSSSTLNVQAVIFGKTFAVSKNVRSLDTLQFRHVIVAGDFGDAVGYNGGNQDTISVYIVDNAGNRSGAKDGAAEGVTIAATFFVDAKLPVLDAGIAGTNDTILPINNDTITNGGLNSGTQPDKSRLTYHLAEGLDTLLIQIGAAKIAIANQGTTVDSALIKGKTRTLNFSALADSTVSVVNTAHAVVKTISDAAAGQPAGSVGGTVATGVHTVTFQGVDHAGNKGPVLTRTNVYVDVDDIKFNRLFPTKGNSLDTLEKVTSRVTFALSEAADSVRILYTRLSGTGTVNRARVLVGSEKTNLGEQTFTVDSLVSNTRYALTVEAADLAGNWTITKPDTFVYDTTFNVPVIASFDIKASKYSAAVAGDSVALTVSARTSIDCVAVTYKAPAVMRITGATGLTVWGTGVTKDATVAGRYLLNADDWVTGARTINVRSTIAPDTIRATVTDSNNATKIYAGAIDSSVNVGAAALSKIAMAVAGGATIGQGDNVWVNLTMSDAFGNNTGTTDFITLSTNAIGVQYPTNAFKITKGTGGFWLNSSGYSGKLEMVARSSSSGREGNLTLTVDGSGATVLDPPDTLAAQDYMGAAGAGDQGGFILLSWPVSTDHATLSGYRIYREITVTNGSNGTGGIAALAAPAKEMVSWATVDAVPGATIMRAVVATLDGDPSIYGVAAERGGLSSSKVAFDGAADVATSYDLMATTMQNAREAAQLDPAAPVFAALTPEALAFDATGVAPRMKVIDGTLLSSIRSSAEAVRAIDNIAPQAVAYLQAIDTPSDRGGSITVQWAKSADDRQLTIVNALAVGQNNTYITAGVAGYNIYRKVQDGAFQLVGKAGPGETSFVDQTTFNGVRYTYSVSAYDADNESGTDLVNSAMAIRNQVVDANGVVVRGLFGADNTVDYDDFFIFADHFGLTAGQDAYEPAFDLAPNNQIDFDDFFAFADNFGRTIQSVGKVVPTMAGLNSDARFALSAGAELPRVGEEMSVSVSLQNFVEVKAYGLTVTYDSELLEYVGVRSEDNVLGEAQLATPQAIARGEGEVYVAAFGDVTSEGTIGLDLIFRSKSDIADSYVEINRGALQDGSYGINQIADPVSVRIETRPDVYALENNYPNPFNPETTIKYQLPEAGEVTLEIYNMLGQVVNTLVSEYQTAGRYVVQWDATNSHGQPLSSGVYFYRIMAGGEFQSYKKMLLLK